MLIVFLRSHILLLVLLTVMLLLPAVTQAFSITEAKAVKVTENAALYTIVYTLGYPQYGLSTPVFVSTTADESRTDAQQVTVATSDPRATAAISGIVLSDAPVIDGEYYVSAGSAATFTLVVAATSNVDAELPAELAVTSLPFQLIDGDTRLQNGLSLGELSDFVISLPEG